MRSLGEKWGSLVHWFVIGLSLCGALHPVSVRGETAVGIPFTAEGLRADLATRSFEYEDWSTLDLPSGLSIAVQSVWLPLSEPVDLSGVKITASGLRRLGAIEPGAMAALDSPTSVDGRYGAVEPSWSGLFADGFVGAAIEGVVTIGGERFLRVLVSPYVIDSAGSVFAAADITFRAESPLGAPLVGATAWRSVMESAPNQSAQRGSSAGSAVYVIVTNEALRDQMQRLADYKCATGVATEVALIEDILAAYSGIDDAASLRDYLKTFFIHGGRYALLAGDETALPVRWAYYYNTYSQPPLENLMVCDLYFADLTGDWDTDGDGVWGEPTHDNPDLTPELSVGRLPISRVEQARSFVDKLILYETDPGLGESDYLERSLIFSSDQMRDFADSGQHAILASALPPHVTVDTTGVVETLSGADPAPSNFSGAESIDRLSDGYGIVNVIAHGRYDGFSVRTASYNEWPKSYVLTSDEVSGHGSVDSLARNGRIGLYVALSCDVGGFDLDQPPFGGGAPSLVESVLTLDSAGAVAMVGYTRWGWVYSSYNLHRAFLEHLYNDAAGDPVAAMNAAAADYPYYRDLIYGQNYFGDPTVRIHTSVPDKYTLDVDTDSWAAGRVTARVSVRGEPVVNEQVWLAQRGVRLADGETDDQGFVTLSAELALGETYSVVATPQNALVSYQEFTPGLAADVDDETGTSLPAEFRLAQNFPNPFNPSTTISWEQPERAPVTLRVYDVLGRTVSQTELGMRSAGAHSVIWEGAADGGAPLASGVYFYQLRAGAVRATRKMTLLK